MALSSSRIDIPSGQEPLLATLYCKAIDNIQMYPKRTMLGDAWALWAYSKINYDWPSLGVDNPTASSVAMRTKLFDDWIMGFVDRHNKLTVIDLGCGLDSRALRLWPRIISRAKSVHWVDVDLAGVAEIRNSVLPEPTAAPNCEYVFLEASVTSESWLNLVPPDRPTVVVLEGLTTYLSNTEGETLVQRLLARFPLRGRLVLDCMVSAGEGSANIRLPGQGWLINNPLQIVRNERIQATNRYVVIEDKYRPEGINIIDVKASPVKIPHVSLQCLQYSWE